jgi:hypothetical protein
VSTSADVIKRIGLVYLETSSIYSLLNSLLKDGKLVVNWKEEILKIKDDIERLKTLCDELKGVGTVPANIELKPAEIVNYITDLERALNEALPDAEGKVKIKIDAAWFQSRIQELKRLRSETGRIYVVERFNQLFLEDVKPGWSFRFDAWVGRYLDDKEDKDHVMEQVNHRNSIDALIDENSRVMYSLGSRRRRWVGSYLPLMGLFAGGLLGLFLDGLFFHFLQSSVTLLNQMGFYILTWGGFGVHIAKKALEQGSENAAIGDIPLWMHVKAASFITLGAGLIGSFYMLLSQNQLNPFAAFTLGYSADSLVSRFTGHYSSRIEKTTEEMKKLMAPKPA